MTLECCTLSPFVADAIMSSSMATCVRRCPHCCLERVTGAVPSLVTVYVPRIAKHAHHPLESSWEMGHRVAHEWTAFCPDLSLPGAACDSVCVCACVWWKGKGGNLHVCCVCMYRTLCSQLKGACMYIELQQQPQCLIFLHKIVVSDFVLSSHLQTQLLNPPGKSLSTRVVILSFLVQTLSHSICRR